jgi:catechol 2,3-dioxygenase-like lactoylglutathione lyase family enzyme
VLAGSKVVAFLATSDAARAKAFYGEVLGLRLLSEDGFAVVFDSNGTTLRVAIVQEVVPAPYTVLGWDVHDITAIVRGLGAAGVVFERYAWLQQDELGIWTAPAGAKVAWFKDLDGNVLSVSQH